MGAYNWNQQVDKMTNRLSIVLPEKEENVDSMTDLPS
jgi:hypothetical protein